MRKERPVTLRPSKFKRSAEYDMLDTSQDFKVVGKHGWFHFIAFVQNHGGTEVWIDASDPRGLIRSIPLDKVKRDRKGAIEARQHPQR